jgi:hypothetical protein
MQTYEVHFTVTMIATVKADDINIYLDDEISDINIPENKQCRYVPDSFELIDCVKLTSTKG